MKRVVRTASHVGKGKVGFEFTISGISAINGNTIFFYGPDALIVQVWRNSKIHKTDEIRHVDAIGPDGRLDTCWPGKIQVPCTLFKTSKGFSSKIFSVSLILRYDARLKEYARGELDLAEFVQDAEGTTAPTQASTLTLKPRGDFRSNHAADAVVLRWTVRQETLATAVEDDDAASHTDSSLLSESTLASAAVIGGQGTSTSEQDLRGFESALERGEASSDGVAPASAAQGLLSVREDEAIAPPIEEVDVGVTDDETPAPPVEGVDEMADSAASGPAPVPVSGKAGWMLKRAVSATMFKNWRRRYVVLDSVGCVVLWRKTPEQAVPQGQLSLMGDDQPELLDSFSASSELRRSPEGILQLHIWAGRKELVLRAVEGLDPKVEMTAWQAAVEATLSQLPQSRNLVSSASTPPESAKAEPGSCVLL